MSRERGVMGDEAADGAGAKHRVLDTRQGTGLSTYMKVLGDTLVRECCGQVSGPLWDRMEN